MDQKSLEFWKFWILKQWFIVGTVLFCFTYTLFCSHSTRNLTRYECFLWQWWNRVSHSNAMTVRILRNVFFLLRIHNNWKRIRSDRKCRWYAPINILQLCWNGNSLWINNEHFFNFNSCIKHMVYAHWVPHAGSCGWNTELLSTPSRIHNKHHIKFIVCIY